MEPLIMFASTVGFIGAFHLLSQAVERLRKEKSYRKTQSDRREDWYCFFQLSDLLGAENTPTQQATLSETEHLKRVRNQHAHRPRLHA